MRDAVIIFVAIILAIVIGGYLFLNGGPTFTGSPVTVPVIQPQTSFVVLAEGQNAGSLDRRTNFRIMTEEEFRELWSIVYDTGGPSMPEVDFSRYEVIAVFDGSHATGGYRAEVTDVVDSEGARTVYITRHVPSDDCRVTTALTSPFVIIRVTKTTLPIVKEEVQVTGCK